jgi:putative Mg2+ transporter-C (MgtC) family protein
VFFGDLTSHEFWLGVGIAAFCGIAIGFERELRRKPAGMRTSALVAVGTYLFVSLSTTLTAQAGDPTRVLGQVVTGIGFLGAGVILTQKDWIKGVTSAAVIWNLAAIGAAVGVGRPGAAIAITLVTLTVLVTLRPAARVVRRLNGIVHYGDDSDD